MKYLTVALVLLNVACNQRIEEKKHLIGNSSIRVGLIKHLDRFDTLTSLEGRLLKLLVLNDTSVLLNELDGLAALHLRHDSITSDRLTAFQANYNINDLQSPERNVFKFVLSESLRQCNTIIILTENTAQQTYGLTFVSYHWMENSDGVYDLGEVSQKDMKISKNDWDEFISLLNESYFWRIIDGRDEDLVLDGAMWTIEASVNEFGRKRNHSVRINNARGSFKEACVFLYQLSGEELRI